MHPVVVDSEKSFTGFALDSGRNGKAATGFSTI